jgi:hypothetical protein
MTLMEDGGNELESQLPPDAIDEAILKSQQFIDSRLKVDLKAMLDLRWKALEEMEE